MNARMLAMAAAMGVVAAHGATALGQRGGAGGVTGTPHDLGPRTGRPDQGACTFCHTPHKGGGEGQLWNVSHTRAAYLMYARDGAEPARDQPTGSSKLCLSCHDGMLAPSIRRAPGHPETSMALAPIRVTLGLDLSNDHPVSIPYPPGAFGMRQGLKPPEAASSGLGGTVSRDRLDADGRVQCTSCHDPHRNDHGNFLLTPEGDAAGCRACHSFPDFDLSVHETEPMPGHASGCAACHTAHGGATGTPLLRDTARRLCGECHAEQALQARGTPTGHVDPSGRPTGRDYREMTCATCHDPHVIRKQTGWERRFLTDPRDPVTPPRLLETDEVPYNGAHDPYRSAESSSDFCLACHDGTWPGALNIRAELDNRTARVTEFVVGNVNMHATHATGAAGGVSCSYCHDVHASAGSRGINRGAGLYPWLFVNEFPYRDRRSCGSTDPGTRCH